jgi:hypothetical protein
MHFEYRASALVDCVGTDFEKIGSDAAYTHLLSLFFVTISSSISAAKQESATARVNAREVLSCFAKRLFVKKSIRLNRQGDSGTGLHSSTDTSIHIYQCIKLERAHAVSSCTRSVLLWQYG